MGYARNNTIVKVQHEPLEASPEIKKSNVSLDQSFIELEDSFLDSLLNFEDWVEDHPNSSLAEVMNSEEKPNMEQMNSLENKKPQACGSEKLGDLIQEEMSKVCLTSGADGPGSNEVAAVDENDIRHETNEMKFASDGDVEGGGDLEEEESSSSSSGSSCSSDDEEEEDDESDEEGVKDVVEMEEGEIREEVLALSDDDDDDDTVKGPIRSTNEVQNLPPVPPVTVTIQPHHQTLPVGVVLSIMGSQVIVEGEEDHNPLSEGSILWITESRAPLGVVDEIFGPVKNPYYIVRYNSETEIPTGIRQGCLISFVPEFADFVLNNNLYKKGYDASGENDEECSEELEFSDDEKEAEYKRMIKMSKRGSSGEKNGRMKKDKKSRNRGGNWKNDHQLSANSQVNGSSSGPQAFSQAPNGSSSGPQAFSQAPSIMPSGVWPYGFPPIQPQNIGFPPNRFPSNIPALMQQNFIQQPFQTSFDPQFSTPPGQMFPGNFVQGVPPNFGAFASWSSCMPQNQSQAGPAMAFQGLPQEVAMLNRLQMENNNGAVRPFLAAGNDEICQNPNQGNGGRKPFQRGGGGGRFRGGPRSR